MELIFTKKKCKINNLSKTPTPTELIDKILIPIAIERNLPIAVKIGAHRGINPTLQQGGDGLASINMWKA